jgi:hypothetical protein
MHFNDSNSHICECHRNLGVQYVMLVHVYILMLQLDI